MIDYLLVILGHWFLVQWIRAGVKSGAEVIQKIRKEKLNSDNFSMLIIVLCLTAPLIAVVLHQYLIRGR